MDFDTRYKKLNKQQQAAVDTIEGPVMVVAGPGTGKTELLSMRAANILRQTDSLPENILCLTFTESGSLAMQKRLTEIIGKNAYNVSIFTFHAFGSEIISRYREYFYRGAEFRPADELNQRTILTSILDELDYNDPLRVTMNGEYTNIKDILKSISEFKRASLTDGEFNAILDANNYAYEIIEPLIQEAIGARISKTTLDSLRAIVEPIEAIKEPTVLENIQPFSKLFIAGLQRAILEAEAHEKTTPPLTTWKDAWTTLDANKKRILKANKDPKKLRSLCYVYGKYIKKMEEAALYDYDDMIMQVVHAIETRPELRYDLQEKYHYIMIDEFQDTNMAQMRILDNLTNNPVVEDSPNILVVGDDDQAIYSFQGADVGNILHFQRRYRNVSLIPLVDNYRSAPVILEAAQDVIKQGSVRLEKTIPGLSKTLVPHKPSKDSQAILIDVPLVSDERQWICDSAKQQLASGVEAKNIAVISRRHSDLEALVPYFAKAGIKVSYDKRENILEDEVVEHLILLARIIVSLYENNLEHVNALLPQLLSHPAWNIDPAIIWRISLEAYKSRRQWLEVLDIIEECKPISQWLLAAAQQVPHLPLEHMLDVIIGTTTIPTHTEFISPLKEYFFSENNWNEDTGSYMNYLQNMISLRNRLREHEPDMQQPRLQQFLHFIAALEESGTNVTTLRHVGEDDMSVRFMSAHGSKGLEFDTVYVINATDSAWTGKGGSNGIRYPENLIIREHTNSQDEFLRLFFVAMTRAKRQLFISYAHEDDSAKEKLIAKFLIPAPTLTEQTPTITHTKASELTAVENVWYAPIIELPMHSKREYLASDLESYLLSATHVNSFIDVTRGGPHAFLLNNLLKFPSARGPAAEFGDAIHLTLQQAHEYITNNNTRLPEEDIIHNYETILQTKSLSKTDFDDYLQKGGDALHAFLAEKYIDFNAKQKAELQFKYQNVVVNEARLTGKMDVVEIDNEAKTIIVTDYKTGKPLHSWDKGQDYEKTKAYKFRQQLLFYKLLVENSRDWRTYTMSEGILQFVEPDKRTAAITALTITDFDTEEIERFKQLISAIWKHIHELNFPDTSHYSQDLKGIKAFEDDLIEGRI